MKRLSYLLLVLFVGLILVGCKHEHTYAEKVVAPTCTEKGYTEYSCKECGDVYQDNEVEAKGHSYSEWVVVQYATEKEEGLKEKTCSGCGDKQTEKVAKVEHEHKYNTYKYVAPTCTEKGYTEYQCECGETKKEKEVEAKGHVLETVEKAVEPTCTEKGKTAKTKCIICEEEFAAEEVEAKGHTEVVLPSKEATCGEKGLTEGKKCSVCGEITVAQKEVAGPAHQVVEIAEYPATCLTDGLSKGKVCVVCNTITEKQNVIKAKEIAKSLPRVNVVLGDGTSHSLLTEEGVEAMDVFVALTSNDEENIIVSMFANSNNVKKSITMVRNDELLNIVNKLGVKNTVSPKHVVANRITSYIRALSNKKGSNVLTLYKLVNNKVEALEFAAKKKSSF